MKLFKVVCDDAVSYLVAAEQEEDCKALILRDEGIVEADGPQSLRVTTVDPNNNTLTIKTDDGRGFVGVRDLFSEATEPSVLGCSEWG